MTIGITIGITIGDPSGIGPEITCAALRAEGAEDIVVFGDVGVLRRCGGLPDGVRLVEVTLLAPADAEPGNPSRAGGAAQVAYLEAAMAAARRGEIHGLVTAPISKTQARAAGFRFPGHTELLAERLGAPEHAMMFAGPRLKVVLATIHVPLATVPSVLTPALVARAIYLGARACIEDFAIPRPRIGVLALNPHAGEGGLFGTEEKEIVVPGIELARQRLLEGDRPDIPAEIVGPLVPDAAFRRTDVDLFVALYHDQGLIPIKLVDFDLAVNVTLGLPIIRTSPDHGVAYDIAGRNLARADSMAAALALARRLVANRGRGAKGA
jgi:4-hydroxythreonine-4-phosphate dehydrogenase